MSKVRGKDHSRGVEHLIYASMWALVILYPLVYEIVQAARGLDYSWKNVFFWWGSTLPFMFLFLMHNYILIPNLLLDSKIKRYALSVLVLLVSFGIYEHLTTAEPRTLPLDVLLGILMLGFNLAIVLLFKYLREQENLKMLENMRMQEELKYLKAQINPHFFMNMLNNIHAMVEVDQERAQDMILELSKLMRYVLYEGDNSMTTFANEVKFISSYVALMRQRYHSDKVEVELNVPRHPSDSLKLPPLLFIAFVENAFKHGISYRRKSTVRISLSENEGSIYFFCRNTKPDTEGNEISSGGVGLENVRRRLDLLYGSDSSLRIEDGSDYYTVNLIIPCR